VTRRLAVIAVAVSMAACGGDDGGGPDARPARDADPRPDGLTWPTCDYVEQNNAGNDAEAEATGLAVELRGTTICGTIAANLPDDSGVVDVDRFEVEFPAGDYLVRVIAPNGRALDAVELLGSRVPFDGYLGGSVMADGHGVFNLSLPAAATIEIRVVAFDDTAPSAPVGYTIVLIGDDLEQRCTAAGETRYQEASDGTGNVDNDVVNVRWASGFSATQTLATTDRPEQSGELLTVGPDTSVRIAGEHGTPNGGALDEYLDKDTYLVVTGLFTNQLDIRLGWDGEDADLDFILFRVPAESARPRVVAAGTRISSAEPELQTMAVDPGTSYWLWIGNYDGSAEPKRYHATICGARITP
jgi:hypothetical protein